MKWFRNIFKRGCRDRLLVWVFGLAVVMILAFSFRLLALFAAIQITITFTLVLVTAEYARSSAEQAVASKKMAEEMLQQRYGSVFPIVDIREQKENATDTIKKGLDIESGKIPGWQSCTLKNIGLGPAVNVCSFIRTPIAGEHRQRDFGTLAVNEEVGREQLSIEQKSGQGGLVAYYKDVYERPFESRRELINRSRIDQAGPTYKIGPLKIRGLTEKEYKDAIRD